MNLDALTAYLAIFMRVADFVVRAVDETHGWAVEWLPFAQARGYVHAVKEGGEISGVAIAGPISSAKLLATRRPASILPPDFEPAGDVLFGAFLFVDPRRRGAGAGLERFAALLNEARAVWPECRRFAYVRRGRLVVRDFPAALHPALEEHVDFQEVACGRTVDGSNITSAELEEQTDYAGR